jgi:predicted nucleic acid-binding protein
MIVDASLILSAFFPDEAQPQAQAVVRDHIAGKISLKSPTLLDYELCNAVWLAEQRGRIDRGQAEQILQTIDGLEIQVQPVRWEEMLPFARQYSRTAYDAAYLALAHASGEALITADKRLYNAVHPYLDWVLWIEDYTSLPA